MKNISNDWLGGNVGGIAIKSNYPCKKGYYTSKANRDVKFVTIHYTGNKTDKAVNNARFYRDSINRQASAHFFVDDDSIYQSVKLKDIAWSVGSTKYYHGSCRNSNQLSIELCDTNGKPSDKTIVVGAYLCAKLLREINEKDVDKAVLRHYDITHKDCPYKKEWIKPQDKFVRFKNYVKVVNSREYEITSKDGLNGRKEPNATSDIKTIVPYGAKVRCYQTKVVNGYTWGKCLFDGLCVWINLHYTK